MIAKTRLIAALAIVLGYTSLARAQTTVSESGTYQSLITSGSILSNGSDGNGVGECAATSIYNSFQFLQASNSGVYNGTELLTGSQSSSGTATRDDLHGLIQSQSGALSPSSTARGLQGDVYAAKQAWVNMYAPGTTTFAGISTIAASDATMFGHYSASTTGGMTFGANATSMSEFLEQQIAAGEDVEIGLYQHMMTLVGVTVNSSSIATSIEYIDPNNASQIDMSSLMVDGFDELTINIPSSMYGPPIRSRTNPVTYSDTSEIYYAFAESAPEPRAAVGISGLVAIGGVFWGRRRKASFLKRWRTAMA